MIGPGTFGPGDRCDRYQIVRLIAAGGAGEVYEATHEFTGRTVALKCLQLRLARRADLRERMRLEAVVLCKIRHANVVTVHDAGITEDGSIVWIAMELLEGCTLRELLFGSAAIPIPQALYYAAGIADGVEAAHELRVVHRDLKPENVFITDRNEVKVLDLGTAKFHGYGLKTTDRMRTIGTPAYMSPEHLRGAAVDSRADVYALSVITYEMLAGRHPFAPEGGGGFPDVYELGALHLFADPRPLTARIAGFPDYVWNVVGRGMAKDRELRPANMGEFAAELRAARRRFVQEHQPAGVGEPVTHAATQPQPSQPVLVDRTERLPAIQFDPTVAAMQASPPAAVVAAKAANCPAVPHVLSKANRTLLRAVAMGFGLGTVVGVVVFVAYVFGIGRVRGAGAATMSPSATAPTAAASSAAAIAPASSSSEAPSASAPNGAESSPIAPSADASESPTAAVVSSGSTNRRAPSANPPRAATPSATGRKKSDLPASGL